MIRFFSQTPRWGYGLRVYAKRTRPAIEAEERSPSRLVAGASFCFGGRESCIKPNSQSPPANRTNKNATTPPTHAPPPHHRSVPSPLFISARQLHAPCSLGRLRPTPLRRRAPALPAPRTRLSSTAALALPVLVPAVRPVGAVKPAPCSATVGTRLTASRRRAALALGLAGDDVDPVALGRARLDVDAALTAVAAEERECWSARLWRTLVRWGGVALTCGGTTPGSHDGQSQASRTRRTRMLSVNAQAICISDVRPQVDLRTASDSRCE